MDFALSRFNMIEGQIKTNRVTDPRLIDVMSEIPRENFVPSNKKSVAYVDDEIEVAPGRYLMEPMVYARMIEAAMLTKDDVVLDIGCATGYSAAVLSQIAGTVIAIESDEALFKKATDNLANLGFDNCIVQSSPMAEGMAEQAPFNVIIINGSIDEVPDAIIDQLADRGRMIAVTKTKGPLSKVSLYTKLGENVSKRELLEAGVGSLPGFEKEQGFVF